MVERTITMTDVMTAVDEGRVSEQKSMPCPNPP